MNVLGWGTLEEGELQRYAPLNMNMQDFPACPVHLFGFIEKDETLEFTYMQYCQIWILQMYLIVSHIFDQIILNSFLIYLKLGI